MVANVLVSAEVFTRIDKSFEFGHCDITTEIYVSKFVLISEVLCFFYVGVSVCIVQVPTSAPPT
jgi:hypothetical protein